MKPDLVRVNAGRVGGPVEIDGVDIRNGVTSVEVSFRVRGQLRVLLTVIPRLLPESALAVLPPLPHSRNGGLYCHEFVVTIEPSRVEFTATTDRVEAEQAVVSL